MASEQLAGIVTKSNRMYDGDIQKDHKPLDRFNSQAS